MTEYPNKLRNLYSASSWRRLCVALFLLLSCVQVQAQDIVVIGWNSDGGDDILFVTTTTISAGTEIYFTDNEWDDVLQAFNSGEGYITYTAPVGGLVAGEVVEILTPGTTGISATQGTAARTGGSFSLTGTGEALYAFTGSDVNTPSEIYFATNNAGGWGTNEEPTGAIAPNLTSVSLASGIDNAEYVGTRSVTSVTTEAPIVGNWTTTNGSGDQSITFDLTDFSATTSTSLNFSSASATVTESDGVLSTTVCVAISSPDATNATSIDVALTGGTASNGIDISTYSTTTLNFPAASSSNECVTITLTDDDWIEGVETLIFEIQNPTGVHSPVLGGVTTHTLTINDDNTGNANGGLFVNELSQGSLGNQEWIELVVTGDPSNPTDLVDLTGWIIDDHDGTAFTGVGGIESGYMFITGDCLNAVPPGSIIVIYREDDIDPTITTLGDDPTDSNKDGVYVFPGNHPCLLTCEPGAPPYTFPCATIDEVAPTFKGGVIFANGGDCGLTRRPDGTLFHALGYESTGTPAAVDPTNSIVFGTEGSNRSYRLECGSWNDATKYSIATGSSADVTPGAPNTSGNSIFINNIRNNTRDTNSDGVADASFDYTNLNDAAHCSGPVAFDYDGDGIIDENDLDDDNDGIPDMLEDAGTGFSPIADADMDGIPNFADTADVTIGFPTFVDINNDGINDAYDTDLDGLADYLDLDADGDGIPDIIEAGGIDTNGDGLIDYPTPGVATSMVDADNDGLADSVDNQDSGSGGGEVVSGTAWDNLDSDGDGLKNYIDLDADNDGITDLVEAGGVDSNGDGIVDVTTDTDGDGFADVFDPDDDGFPGIDSGEGSAPLVETDGSANWLNGETGTSLDFDGDGIENSVDLDTDNDGIPDLVEAGGIDTNGDGRVDTTTDNDGDGYADIYDSDKDGGPGAEASTAPLVKTGGTDTDGDNKADDSAITFINGIGSNIDTDNDGLADLKDLDADNDGIPDIVEVGATDSDNDGMVNTAAQPWDADGDGLADIYDEAASDGPAGSGINGTALVETSADSNGDGIVNATETMTAGGTNKIQYDSDTVPNHLDLDSDNDGITDVVENAAGDTDADNGGAGNLDGIINGYTDVDGNGWNDASTSAVTDTDSDNVADYKDIDADNDGISDYIEGVCTTCPTSSGPSGNDTDGDGLLDIYESMSTDNTDNTTGTNQGITPNKDTDDSGDNNADYTDTDTDGDGSYDWNEGFDTNGDGKSFDDLIIMAANYESANTNPGHYTTTDTDLDGLPDWLDNLAGPGYTITQVPPFLNPASGFYVDGNADGLVALFDAAENGTTAPIPDNNAVNDGDWRDMATNVSLPLELLNFTVSEYQCQAIIEWTTLNELNIQSFDIGYSRDGRVFHSVEDVTANGGNYEQHYQVKLSNGNPDGAYQLKIISTDGEIEYTALKYLEVDCIDFEVYPNPIHQKEAELIIDFRGGTAPEQLLLYNQLGVLAEVIKIQTDEQTQLSIDLSHLSHGMYYLQSDEQRIDKIILLD